MSIKDDALSIFVMKNICYVNERSRDAGRKSIHYKRLAFKKGQWDAFQNSLREKSKL